MVFMLVAFIWYKYFPLVFNTHPEDLIFFPGSGQPWTVVTAIFLHGGWLHLLGNLVYFNVFGPLLESRVGHGMFFVYVIMMGALGNIVHGFVASQGLFGQYGVGVLGASGAIAGLLAFSMIRFHNAKVEIAWWVFAPLMGQNRAGRSKVALQVAVGLWLLLQVVHALVASQTGGTVSYGAHFGGFFMGLSLALAMGQWREGHLEGLRDKAADYFKDGAYHASVGMWLEYLELLPSDWSARLELARAQVLGDQVSLAAKNFRKVFQYNFRIGNINGALDVFQEANRASLISTFTPEEMAKIAYYQEKQLDFVGAIKTHQILWSTYPESSEGQRSLVRIIMLYKGKVNQPATLRHWLETANQTLPEGGWRQFLVEEFKTQGGIDASGGQDPSAALPTPGNPEPCRPKP